MSGSKAQFMTRIGGDCKKLGVVIWVTIKEGDDRAEYKLLGTQIQNQNMVSDFQLFHWL